MGPILNSAILDSAILHKTLTQTNSIWLKLIHSHTTWWWQPSWILPSWIWSSWIQTPSYLLSDSLKNTLPPLLLLTQTNLIWLKLIHSHSIWWWQPSWILPSWIWPFGFSHLSFFSQTHSHLPRLVPTIWTKKPSLIHSDSTWWWQPSWILTGWIKKTSLIHSHSTWWWQPSWILPCWIQTPCFLLSDSLKNTLPPLWLLTQTNLIWLKLIHSHSTWWWQPSWILSSWIWPSWIQPS